MHDVGRIFAMMLGFWRLWRLCGFGDSTQRSSVQVGNNHKGTHTMALASSASSASTQEDDEKRRERINASGLYFNVPSEKVPVVYSSSYNISFFGLEKIHPFDASKWGRIKKFLADDGVLSAKCIVEPVEATKDDLLVVHTENYLESLKQSYTVAAITEVPPVALLPNFIVQRRVLQPFRKQVGGTVLGAKLAKERGWAINLGGGFHHCCGYEGGGFCAYADITLAIKFAFERLAITRVMIIDLDAHQGNGHARDFVNDDRVYIFDMYNSDIYPRKGNVGPVLDSWVKENLKDHEAKKRIDQPIALRSGTSSDKYLTLLAEGLMKGGEVFKPELVVYNAGTDILEGDSLGRLFVTPEGVKQRDEMVFQFAKDLHTPIVMLTSGGYMKTSARVIADSITNLAAKKLISFPSSTSNL